MIDWSIIDKSLEGIIDPEEQKILDSWLNESPEHKELYSKILSREEYSPKSEQYNRWRDKFAAEINRLQRKRRMRLIISPSIAAVLILGLVIASQLFFNNKEINEITISPGSPKASLQLASGELINLQQSDKKTLIENKNSKVVASDETLSYTAIENIASEQVEYNTLTTARGGEWTLLLSDGTKVHLNSNSKLHYPVLFGSKERRVYLEGEAYFEVTSEKERAFIVSVGEGNIKVLGTQFNINGYPAKEKIYTTLVSGSVEFFTEESNQIISPGQQLVYNNATKEIAVTDIDTELFTSWKEGYFKFEQTRFADILDQISLWYDVNIIYKDESIKELTFTSSGLIPRYENIRSLLSKFEYLGNIEFNLKGRDLIIKRK